MFERILEKNTKFMIRKIFHETYSTVCNVKPAGKVMLQLASSYGKLNGYTGFSGEGATPVIELFHVVLTPRKVLQNEFRRMRSVDRIALAFKQSYVFPRRIENFDRREEGTQLARLGPFLDKTNCRRTCFQWLLVVLLLWRQDIEPTEGRGRRRSNHH